MPVPDFSNCDLSRLQAAATSYLEAATLFTKKFQASAIKAKSSGKSKKAQKLSGSGQMRLGFVNGPTDEEISDAKERLRGLHWRVDAEVLRLYALPPELERELLDTFDGVRRQGVPFEQIRYIPREFGDVLTLDDFLRITDEWDATETRRCKLVEKRIKSGRRTAEEEVEFRQLQRLLMLRRRFYSPLPTVEIRALTKQIKKAVKWKTIEHVGSLCLSLTAARPQTRANRILGLPTIP